MPVKVPNSNQILSLLENFTLTRWEDISADIASDFRRRRIEKNLTRKQIAEQANVALPTVARFEQRGLISLEHLIRLAMALGYTSEIRHIFSSPKYQTLEELDLIKKNQNKKKATGK
ncbi:MAG: helix-turn-helix domain-containing protein [Bacteroides sp.]|nr:helix-turn-helix domain-containing protein [Bacteroides sp.]MBD5372528.1 helix-turn-helix domain-containing protein [Bacteroides sp.]